MNTFTAIITSPFTIAESVLDVYADCLPKIAMALIPAILASGFLAGLVL